MKNKFIKIFFFCGAVILNFSCSRPPVPAYSVYDSREMTEIYDGGKYKAINLKIIIEKKMTPEELDIIGDDLQEKYSDKKSFDIRFAIPKLYDDCENIWAELRIKPSVHKLRFNGTRKHQEDSLLKLVPGEGDLLGKWYLYDPLREQVLFMLKKNNNVLMEIHEFDTKPGIETVVLSKDSQQDSTYSGPDKKLVFRIESDGKLFVISEKSEQHIAYSGSARKIK